MNCWEFKKCDFYTSEHYDVSYGQGQKDPLKQDNNVSQQAG